MVHTCSKRKKIYLKYSRPLIVFIVATVKYHFKTLFNQYDQKIIFKWEYRSFGYEFYNKKLKRSFLSYTNIIKKKPQVNLEFSFILKFRAC